MLTRLAEHPTESAILLDVDGTLAPIVARPEIARVPEETRAEVRRLVAKTNIRTSLLGFQVRFAANGEMRSPANFGVYRIARGGVYQRVA